MPRLNNRLFLGQVVEIFIPMRFERKELDKKFDQMEIRLSILETNEALILSGQKSQALLGGSN